MPPGFLAIEVYDNGAPALQLPATTDVVSFGTKYPNVGYVLQLTGPSSGFSGNGIPPVDLLEHFWTSAVFVVRDSNLAPGAVTLSAAVTGLSIAAVPEPSPVLLVGVGATAAAFLRRRPKRTVRPA